MTCSEKTVLHIIMYLPTPNTASAPEAQGSQQLAPPGVVISFPAPSLHVDACRNTWSTFIGSEQRTQQAPAFRRVLVCCLYHLKTAEFKFIPLLPAPQPVHLGLDVHVVLVNAP